MSNQYQCRAETCTREFESEEGRDSHEGWMHDITKEYQDPDILRNLYYKKGMMVKEIAEKLDSSPTTILRYMEKNGIERRKLCKHQQPVHLRWKDGYRVWATKMEGEQRTVRVHRLVAVAKYGIDAVKDMYVHHKNGIRWDNRNQNLELMTPSNHSRHHANLYHNNNGGEQS